MAAVPREGSLNAKFTISLQWGPVNPKYHVKWVAPSNHSSSQNTRLNDLSYGIKIWKDSLPFCHNPHVWQTDRWTDRLTLFLRLDLRAFNAVW